MHVFNARACGKSVQDDQNYELCSFCNRRTHPKSNSGNYNYGDINLNLCIMSRSCYSEDFKS